MYQKTLYISIIILLIQLVLMMVILDPAHVLKEHKREVETVIKWFGIDKTKSMYVGSKDSFEFLFIDNGVKQNTYEWLLPDEAVKQRNTNKGIEELGNLELWPWIEKRLDAFWLILKAGFFRFNLLLFCVLHCLPFAIPLLIDGLARREISKTSEDNASPILYKGAKVTLIGMLLMPVILIVWPFAVSPIYVGWWALLLGISAWFLAGHTQHRL